MAIKLKNMSKKWYMKAAAYVILMVCIIGSSITIWEKRQLVELDSLFEETYGGSSDFNSKLSNYMFMVNNVAEYNNAQEITPDHFEDSVVERLMNNGVYDAWVQNNGDLKIEIVKKRDFFEFAYTYPSTDYLEEEETYPREDTSEMGVPTENTQGREDLSQETFLKEFSDLKEEAKTISAEIEKRMYNDSLRKLKENTDFLYRIVSHSEVKNTLAIFEKLPIAGYYDGNEAWSKGTVMLNQFYNDDIDYSDKAVFVGVSQNFYNEKQVEWNKSMEVTRAVVQSVCVYAGIALLMLLYLVIITGYEPDEKKAKLYVIDRIWSEIQLIAGGFSIFFFACCFVYSFEYDNGGEWLFRLMMVGAVITSSLALACFLSQVRRLKTRKFLDGFICFRICSRIIRKIYLVIKASWQRGKLSKRALLLAILLPLLCATWFGAPFVVAFLIYMIYKYIGDFNEIVEGTKKIREGGLTHKIIVKDEGGVLGELAENINTLSQGLEAAVSNELRSERLKAELISNVSHDLKTPLTSIVTYVDLLKKENLDNEAARNYIDVIDRKTQRLNVLTNDLFEAAKASSGAMPVNLEKVDLNAIVRQALGEFDEKIQNANLEIRKKLPENGAYIIADGKLTWRVLDNLLTNVIKYGLKGSRVYMEVEEENQVIVFTMKNISAYELNIPTQELMERFKRGDESRNSEGSGLGLSIANSLVVLQHGSFEISIDGDLFKVTMCLPKYLKNE